MAISNKLLTAEADENFTFTAPLAATRGASPYAGEAVATYYLFAQGIGVTAAHRTIKLSSKQPKSLNTIWHCFKGQTNCLEQNLLFRKTTKVEISVCYYFFAP